ncbi:cilia- and flagella-associated protein 61-like [Adelges cooleyi]|uniref:cilia- and flagella-associated protein 61-like n=1 Tax=Adelges cooleyi TaxID=133065 RepID=UPI00217F26A4|nr:cilia- and flagella-associated protein 61-like [Adelges cooleyi]
MMDQHETTYTSLISEFIPVKPRIRIQCDNYVIPKVAESFALYHMNSRLSTVANVCVDAKIVVIGASDVALSFLENLIFNASNHYVVFENITLVSDRGIRFKYELNDLENGFLPITSHYSYEYMKSMSLNTWVNVVTGTVTAINRIDKHIIVDESHYVYYDYLFLFCGEQFVCDYVCKDIDFASSSVSHDAESENSANIVRPIKNLFVLNTEEDVLHASMSLEKLKAHTKDVVVYGKCLESLTVINTLLKSGIKGSRIVYIENKLDEKMSFIESEYIAKRVYEELVKNNVNIHKSCRFVEWKLSENDTQINKLTTLSQYYCIGLVMIRASMKFDGHLVVSNSFQTNDEYVLAAGPVAKFNPNNREDGMLSHSYFNSVEVGSNVAKTFGALVGVFEEPSSIELIQPIFMYCHLPRDYQYLYCAIPGFKYYEEITKTIKTGDKNTGYFEMTLDAKGLVIAFSCYSKNKFHHLNLIHLCGKSISLFDSMLDRFENNTLPCLFEYFEEPWAQAIYSDKFDSLLEVLNMHWSNVKFKIAELAKVTKVEEEFKDKCLKLIQNVMLKFVEDNLDELPMYSHPITISKLLDEQASLPNATKQFGPRERIRCPFFQQDSCPPGGTNRQWPRFKPATVR